VNPSTLQGAAALVLGTVIVVWVYLLRTNIIRWYRWPLAAIAIAAGYTLVVLNGKIESHTRMAADTVTSWENIALSIVTVLVFALPAMHWLHEWHQKRCAQPIKRSHAHMQAHR
jgi:hypothetical protein